MRQNLTLRAGVDLLLKSNDEARSIQAISRVKVVATLVIDSCAESDLSGHARTTPCSRGLEQPGKRAARSLVEAGFI